jgi:cellulose synthase/poly-beta-1,6-N-acetylglucosamine synthase-like glycosyltransferase
MNTLAAIGVVFGWGFLLFFIAVAAVNLGLHVLALRALHQSAAERTLAAMPPIVAGLEPGVTICIPAFNEERTIATSVRSMFEIDYPEFEVVVVNDGSTDATLEVLRREFALEPFAQAYRRTLPVAELRGIYRSRTHARLLVIDKLNGGRSDAVNAAVNAARHGLVCIVDADSVLERDSLRRAVRPLAGDPAVIASGGTIRIANGCRIERGRLLEAAMPRRWLPRIQVLEYLRGFHNSRIGWAALNALPIISGAFGVFRRRALVAAGGLSTATVGEDMELTLRLHRLHRFARRDYRIAFVPDAVCWTEAPETLSVLRSQRKRWQRGLLESLATHRPLFGDRRAGAVGWLAWPSMGLVEALAPLVELVGYAVFFALWFTGTLSWQSALVFLLLAWGTGLLLSASTLLIEAHSFRTYPRLAHLGLLLGAMLVENFGYRQLTVWWRVRATVEWLMGRKAVWGQMKRRGAGAA